MHLRESDPKRLWYQQIFGSFEPDFARFPFNRFGGLLAFRIADVASVFDEAAVDVDRVDLEEWIRSALSASLSIGSSIKASSFSAIAGSEHMTKSGIVEGEFATHLNSDIPKDLSWTPGTRTLR